MSFKVKINGKNYNWYYSDNEDTIRHMVALNEGTFQQNIKFTQFNLAKNKIVIKLLSTQLTKLSINTLIDTVQNIAKEWNSDTTTIALEWLTINNYNTSVYADKLKAINETDFWNKDAVDNLRNMYEERLDYELKQLEKLTKNEETYRAEYTKFKEVPITKFYTDSIIVEYELEIINADPFEMFDNAVLKDNIKFMRLSYEGKIFYKFNVIPDKDWLEGEETLIIKIQGAEEWETAIINMTDTGSFLQFDVANKKQEETLVVNLLSIFRGIEIKKKNRREKGIKGNFAIPDKTINRDVLLDLITNEPLISHYFYVDETQETSSRKNVLYIYYSPGENEQITMFLSEKITSRSDEYLKQGDLTLYTPYINIRIFKAQSEEKVLLFSKFFSIVLDIYEHKFNKIMAEYKKIIPTFKSEKKKKVGSTNKKLVALQMQDQNLFVFGYPIKCERKKQPIPIDKSEVSKYKKKTQVLNYPTGSDNYFICDDPKFKFPGIIKNNLTNVEEYAYLPCCYKEDQTVGNKLLAGYLREETKPKTKQTGTIIMKKALSYGKIGYLPKNIYLSFKKEMILREGVPFGVNSFISAVLLAVDEDYEKADEKEQFVRDFRNNIVNYEDAIQQIYGTSRETFINNIKNPEHIFNSKLYIGLLEHIFNCRIIVFIKDDDESNGDIELPAFSHGYLYRRLDDEKRLICIYKHYGMRSDNLQNPHYELIIMKKGSVITRIFNDQKLNKNLDLFMAQKDKLYIGDTLYTPKIQIPEPDGQTIDQFGKAIGFTFKNIYLSVSPVVPSVGVKIVVKPEITALKKDVLQFVKENNYNILSQDISGDKSIGIVVRIPGIIYSQIGFKAANKLDGMMETSSKNIFLSSGKDYLNEFISHKKTAAWIGQLLFFSFSLWFNEKLTDLQFEGEYKTAEKMYNTFTEFLINSMNTFMSKNISIKDDVKYPINVPRYLTINNGFFKNDKLILDKKVNDKLAIYVVHLIRQDPQFVIKYSLVKKYLDEYYVYPSDFKQQKSTIIFMNTESVLNWIDLKEYLGENTALNMPDPRIKEPFYFWHWNLNHGKPVIIQNVLEGDINRALTVSKNFVEKKINLGFNVEPLADKPAHAIIYIQNRILYTTGYEKIAIWKYDANFYSAILYD